MDEIFKAAVAVWRFDGLNDAAGKNHLKIAGGAEHSIKLDVRGQQESSLDGGDGMVAQLDGGWFDAGQGAEGALNLKGAALTVCARLRSPSGAWGGPLFSKYDGHDKLVYNLFSSETAIGFELGTQRTPGMTQVTVPVALIGAAQWHQIICRYDGAKMQLFADGVWMDEGFPMGPLREGNTAPCLIGAESVAGAIKSGWKGQMDHVAIWNRALSDAEIERLSGGSERVAERKKQYVAPLPSLQYYKPRDPFNIGDTLPLFHDGVFHFYYLRDRGHHTAKNRLGAHQWAHASSTDLVHWQDHPLAVAITHEDEGSICTGSVFVHDGVFHGFYATRGTKGGERLSLATSGDGVQFTKTLPNPFLSPGAKYTSGFRDPHVFRDERSGQFHLIVSTMLAEKRQACLAQYISKDLKTWEETAPLLIEEQKEVPECPDCFAWNGWHYLIYSYGQVARYRMSRDPLGPWTRPAVEVLDGKAARVMKTAAFANNRRIGTASVWPHGYAGWAVFRELVQNPDGTLGTKFVPEMLPPSGEPLAMQMKALDEGASGDARALRLNSAGGRSAAELTPLPLSARIRLRVDGKAEAITLNLRSSETDARGNEVRILPPGKRVLVTGAAELGGVEGLDKPFTLDIVVKDRILDLCLNEQRTLVNWVSAAKGDRLILGIEKGDARFKQIEVNPLK